MSASDGRTIRLSEVGLGCAGIGNLFSGIDDDRAREVVDTSWDCGVRYFDTAPHYGLGLSERRLGEALRDRVRDEFIVSTKVGRILEPNPAFTPSQRDSEGFDVPATMRRRWDFSADGVRRSLESSLDRLNMDRVELVLIHDPDDDPDGYGQALTDAVPALERLREQGVIRAFGVGTRHLDTLERFVRQTSIDVVMLAGRFTLLNHDALASLLPACSEYNVSVVNAGIFNSGILAERRPRAGAMFEYQRASAATLTRARAIADVCDRFDTSLPRVAFAFARSHPAIASVVMGASSAAQAKANAVLASEPEPSVEFWTELIRRDLVEAGALEGLRLAG